MPSYVVNHLLCVGVGDSWGNDGRDSNRVFRKIGGEHMIWLSNGIIYLYILLIIQLFLHNNK